MPVSRPNEASLPRDAAVAGEAPPRPVVVLTGSMSPAAAARLATVAELRQVPDTQPDTLRAWAQDAEVLVVRTQLPPDIFEHTPRLRGVVRQGVGLDMIPMAAATACGLPVANVPGSNRHAVAEHVLACLGELMRRVCRMNTLLRQAGWASSAASMPCLASSSACRWTGCWPTVTWWCSPAR